MLALKTCSAACDCALTLHISHYALRTASRSKEHAAPTSSQQPCNRGGSEARRPPSPLAALRTKALRYHPKREGFGRAPYHKAVIFYKSVRGVRPRVRRTTRGNRGTALQQRSQVCLQIAERPNRHTVCHALRASHALFYLSDAPSGARREPELAPPSRRRQHREGQRRWRPGLDAEWRETERRWQTRGRRQRHMLPRAAPG